MELIGRVLWYSDKDENGIIVDPNGNEFYFDRSVLNLKSNQVIKRNSVVTFNYNESIKDCLCACNVAMASASQSKAIQSKVSRQPSASV
ncbi:hypothetical protein [Peredibacter starrii]|uniref:CSD domain-containing protein n=1 Tax=Peredibacter starrii TaxID=28202 RepID=A0AAX4HRH2_9BACT|nr:hypothetical protein [Peredibacter starrii]WPU65894.1 hypothetical protein SOO65_03965 [Peredibacter starrii]